GWVVPVSSGTRCDIPIRKHSAEPLPIAHRNKSDIEVFHLHCGFLKRITRASVFYLRNHYFLEPHSWSFRLISVVFFGGFASLLKYGHKPFNVGTRVPDRKRLRGTAR